MPRQRKKDPGKKPEEQTGIPQDAQGPSPSQTISSQELDQILKQILQQQRDLSQEQKQSQTGSSTPSGSSIQQPQTKPSSSKKTLASYAMEFAQKKIPDKTYSEMTRHLPQTLKQQALAILPNIKTITKQEYDDLHPPPQITHPGKISGTIMPSSQPQTQMTVASSSKAIVQVQTQQAETPYFHKEDRVKSLAQVEPEFYNKNPNQVASNIFPSGWYFRPTDFQKTRVYYELILVHSGSAQITRYEDPKDKSLITHSTLQILQVLTPSQWGQDLHKPKNFGIQFEPEGYNYWDYIEAWSNVFWDQNKLFKHSWFIYFKIRTKYQFPQWFVHWWSFFGPVPEILPPIALRAFEHFKNKFNCTEDPFPVDLHYFSKLSVAWIFSWSYRLSQTFEGSCLLPQLQRLPSVRWWPRFELKRADIDAVDKWFKQNPQHLCMTEQSKFLNQRQRVQSILASTTDKASLINQLGSMLQLLQQQDQTASSQQQPSSSATSDDEEETEFIVDLGDD